ncbi:unnamed protein product, partial [marine sediment metagenome]
KGTTFEESVGMDKFIECGENCYIGVNTTLASHFVEGIFGNISYFKIKVGNNVTSAAFANIAPGCEIFDDSYLLPLASTPKHSVLKGGKHFYYGMPMRRIFRRKIMEYLDVKQKDLERNANIEGYKDKKLLKQLKEKERRLEKTDEVPNNTQLLDDLQEEKIDINSLSKEDLAIDFTTSSAISRVNVKFLLVYIPIFWISGLLITILWYWYSGDIIDGNSIRFHLPFFLFFPVILFGLLYIFIVACVLFSKLLLILVNLIHRPKEGVFKATIGNTDFEFWQLRTQIKKISLWFLRNSPFPWTDVIAFQQLGVDMDFSSHLADTWCDSEFIKLGRKVLIGQGATIMSSMVVGKYLLIKGVLFDDYVMVGGQTSIAPGTIIKKESVIGAISS